MATNENRARRAIGIVRVSQVNGREGESFASPDEQRERVEQASERDGLDLLEVIPELDVSGGTPLAQRDGLRRAVEAVEAGDADVIVAAYFDRLVRSLKVQAELIERVEAAGGQVLALDTGEVTNGSAGQWLSGTMLGAVAEYQRRSTAERTAEAQVRAVARGVWMGPSDRIPPGYLRGDDGVLVPGPEAAVVAEGFEMRAGGATVAAVREHLRSRGLDISYAAALRMLKSRAYLGEVHFGKLHNGEAHDRIVEPETWKRAQRAKPSRGRRAKSQRLLARLGVLRCGSCDRPMSATTGHNGTWPAYRCGAHPGDDCPRRQTIGAKLVEGAVTEYVRDALDGIEGHADARQSLDDAARALDRAEQAYRAAVEALDPTEPAEVERLAEFRQARDAARERYESQRAAADSLGVVISAGGDWDALTASERRDLIRAVIERVVIRPGRGRDRISIEPTVEPGSVAA